MSDKEFVLDSLRSLGTMKAQQLQTNSKDMSGTELNAEADYIPDFQAACAKQNMNTRSPGFVCKSTAGRVVKLLQVYDSTIYTQEPEELPAQWGFVWSTNPEHALPFIALSTSPYNVGEVCSVDGVVYRSKQANNVWSPVDQPDFWEVV